jgi:non-canonical (house-cleaning) NTP pyrophosphatase
LVEYQVAHQKLLESQQPIYLQKGGEHRGLPVGIPHGVADAVITTLTAIMLEEQPVDVPTVQGARQQARAANITVNQEDFFKSRKYRDCAYAILASMYSQTVDEAAEFTIKDIKRVAQTYTDHRIDYDYRVGVYGGMPYLAEEGVCCCIKDMYTL